MISPETVNAIAQHWAAFVWSRMLGSTLLMLIVGVLWSLVRRRVSAQFGYCLFLLVLVKLVVPIQTPLPAKAGRMLRLAWAPAVITHNVSSETSSKPVERSDEAVTTSGPVAQKAGEPEQVWHWPLSISAMLMIVWLAVVVILLCWFAYTEWATVRVIKRSHPVDLTAASISLNRLGASVRLRRSVRVVANPSVVSPVVYGLWSPTLLIPAGFADHHGADQIRWMLLHELAHVQRWDMPVRLFQKVVQFVFFFHPVVWLANILIDRQREYACDDTAVLGSNLSRADCGESFLHIVARINQTRTFMPGVLGILSPNTIVRKRLMRMLDQNRTPQSRLSPGAYLWLALVALLLVPFSGIASTGTTAVAESEQAAVTAELDNMTFPTEGYTQKDKQCIWKQSLSANVGNVRTVLCLSHDADVSVKPHKDASKNAVDVHAAITLTPKGELANDPDALKELLALKEKVGVTLRRDDKKTPSPDDDTLTVQTVMPKETPEDIKVSVSMEVLMPARLALNVISADGDTKAKDLAGPVTIKAADGDVAVSGCLHSISITSADGDANVADCTGPVALKTADGDVKVTKCSKAVAVESADGDVVLTDVQAQVDVKTADGDIKVSFAREPAEDCSLRSSDGDIMVVLPTGSNVTLDLKTNEGEARVDAPGFEGAKKENSVTGKLNKGGPAIRTRSDDGDVLIEAQ